MPPESPRADAPSEQATFAGKRRAPRKRRTLSIECRGPGGLRVEARTVDVSRGGTLIEITDPDVFSTDRSAPFAGRAQELEALFPSGIDVSFGEGAVLAFARIIRHVVDVERPEMVLLGCKFAPELSPVDCRLLGIDFESDETSGAVESDEPSVRRDGDELVAFISTPGRAWTAPKGPTDSTPVPSVRAPGPQITLAPAGPPAKAAQALPIAAPSATAARIVYKAKSRPTEIVASAAATAPPPSSSSSASSTSPAAPARPAEIPTPNGEGLNDDHLRRMGRDRRRTPAAAVTGRASEWAGADGIAVYLFPAMAGALAPRYHGKLVLFDACGFVVGMPVPASDVDPVGHGAGLGEQVRAVFVRDGHVLGESNCRVVRLVEGEGRTLNASLVPHQEPSDGLKRAIARR
jgi:hypothetical protein